MHKLTIDGLVALYNRADTEGKEHLKETMRQKEDTLNAIAAIQMNSCTQIKRMLQDRIGQLIIEERSL